MPHTRTVLGLISRFSIWHPLRSSQALRRCSGEGCVSESGVSASHRARGSSRFLPSTKYTADTADAMPAAILDEYALLLVISKPEY